MGTFLIQAIGYDNAGLVTETDTRAIYVGVDPPGAGESDDGADGGSDDGEGEDDADDDGDSADAGADGADDGTAGGDGGDGDDGEDDEDDAADGTGGGSAGQRGDEDDGCACCTGRDDGGHRTVPLFVLLAAPLLRRRRA